jgi:hypothetical protein
VSLSQTDLDRLFEGDNPLATFSAEIKLGYALGNFGQQTRADLNCNGYSAKKSRRQSVPFWGRGKVLSRMTVSPAPNLR